MTMSTKLAPVALAAALMVGGIGSAAAHTDMALPDGAVMMADSEMDVVRGERTALGIPKGTKFYSVTKYTGTLKLDPDTIFAITHKMVTVDKNTGKKSTTKKK